MRHLDVITTSDVHMSKCTAYNFDLSPTHLTNGFMPDVELDSHQVRIINKEVQSLNCPTGIRKSDAPDVYGNLFFTRHLTVVTISPVSPSSRYVLPKITKS